MGINVLCIPLSAAGHTNPVIGLASLLHTKGHSVVFATERSWRGRFVKLGFGEEIYDNKPPKEDDEPLKYWTEVVKAMAPGFRQDRSESIMNDGPAFKGFIEAVKYSDERIGQIIETVKPDVIIYENLLWHPSVLKSNVPVVQLIAGNPLFGFRSDNLPPASFGLSIYSEREEWTHCRQIMDSIMPTFFTEYFEFLKSKDAPQPKPGDFRFTSSNLNILLYPRSLIKDYLDRTPEEISKNFIVIDHALRPIDREFELPEKLKSMPGKLIYLSMGSMGSVDTELMELLIRSLGRAKGLYKFIVSTGMLHEKYKLADNMWGQPYVPQLGVLPLVDLAIIHGGNNSFIETLYFGKPMIVIPLFGDQPDNAQRAEDAKVGARYNPFRSSGLELIQLIHMVLGNEHILENVKRISKEMQESKSLEEAVEKIEFVAKNPKLPSIIV